MDPKKAYIVKTTGEITEVSPNNGRDFSLEELKAAIGGGYIELVIISQGRYLCCDEDGHSKRLSDNPIGTPLYWEAGGFPNPILGDILICPQRMIR